MEWSSLQKRPGVTPGILHKKNWHWGNYENVIYIQEPFLDGSRCYPMTSSISGALRQLRGCATLTVAKDPDGLAWSDYVSSTDDDDKQLGRWWALPPCTREVTMIEKSSFVSLSQCQRTREMQYHTTGPSFSSYWLKRILGVARAP